MGIFDELFESHRKHGKRHHHDHHTYHHDGRRHGSREAWPYHASHSHDSGDRHGARYLPYLHWLAQHPGVLISLALLMLVLLVGMALFLWPLATKLLGFVAVDGIQGVTDEAARTVSRLWYGWSR